LSQKHLVIAIDGPAASGKSTTAKLVAERLGYLHVDTGAMYRAVTLKILRREIELNDVAKIAKLVSTTRVELSYLSADRQSADSSLKVSLDGEDVTHDIRSLEVTKAVSAVSSIKEVRAAMVREQQKMGEGGGIVMDGRDIGTVVFPDADLKIFMVASIHERARRRAEELNAKGLAANLELLKKEIVERDRLDSTRNESPLRKADDAVKLDTSNLTIDEQVEFIVTKARQTLSGAKGLTVK
jgi:cytidylate kinase